jgi:nucleotide-binding universal stress UspA family protein
VRPDARVTCIADPCCVRTFKRVMCGIDGTPEGDAALTQALALMPSDAHLVIAHAFALASLNEVELMLGEASKEDEERAHELVEDARARAIASGRIDPDRIELRVMPGPKARGLLELIDATGASVLAVGIHGHSRLGGAIRGSAASNALHSATCSVLIARERHTTPDAKDEASAGSFPRDLVCGVDGSESSRRAVDAAREIASRTGCRASYVAAEDGRDVEFTEASLQTESPGELEIESGRPLEVLLARAAATDLLIVGSRGRGGARAIGSIAERVAHEADCSVLVAR